ncbi:hypothetical protein BRADI_4g29286v3 [Brachypodium distachyon]|uniref:Uncharacterized protein n=1 Tax=Brachypodium distachyon TaxID=15368 RepID=A0A2K2CR39_BRADI|nr:hypothetical protein BRADI_4g29286v3 [Brachypodium distachyon]PNT64490.1 hypothetical protein BRADI_4g29286v3 [Brachypodium distachyon]PNT64491.1 hypothetical protein BRADI_4g29286v3 [Brachypodium distachyon]PNT64492.1 hypothetical protein BRADI_4g29286v3 [Brachypodium distachyon]
MEFLEFFLHTRFKNSYASKFRGEHLHGVIAFSGTVMVSSAILRLWRVSASPTIHQYTVFLWQRLRLSTRGRETWAILALGLRWKSCYHIQRAKLPLILLVSML